MALSLTVHFHERNLKVLLRYGSVETILTEEFVYRPNWNGDNSFGIVFEINPFQNMILVHQLYWLEKISQLTLSNCLSSIYPFLLMSQLWRQKHLMYVYKFAYAILVKFSVISILGLYVLEVASCSNFSLFQNELDQFHWKSPEVV